jgi:hypothetical protein
MFKYLQSSFAKQILSFQNQYYKNIFNQQNQRNIYVAVLGILCFTATYNTNNKHISTAILYY